MQIDNALGESERRAGDSRLLLALTATYDSRLRARTWDVSGVMGWEYSYDDFGERSGRVTYAKNLYDATLDRSYDYDQVGRLFTAYTGSEARAHTGRPGGGWGVHDGPYSLAFHKDVWGNVTQKQSRPTDSTAYTASYTSNRRDGFTYDAAGHLTNDGAQGYAYDATGQQTQATSPGYALTQSYDGDRLRVKKEEYGTTYYLRSSVLGGQVVAELNAAGGWMRGYVYLGSQLLAIQASNSVTWVHQDPATKSQRLTNSAGAVTTSVDLDPWGMETGRSENSSQQPRKYTTYERDANSSDEAMMRRYNSRHQRFDQPDPYDGSYDLTDPQSLNRYAYVGNDPVNFVDPSGLMMCGAEYSYSDCGGGGGFWGGNFGGDVAEYGREYGGMPQGVVEGLRSHNQRVDNARGGYGFITMDLTRFDGHPDNARCYARAWRCSWQNQNENLLLSSS